MLRVAECEAPAPFFCRVTLRYQVVCPLGPGWGCPYADETPSSSPRARTLEHAGLRRDARPADQRPARLIGTQAQLARKRSA
jgi:hypothetical protein